MERITTVRHSDAYTIVSTDAGRVLSIRTRDALADTRADALAAYAARERARAREIRTRARLADAAARYLAGTEEA